MYVWCMPRHSLARVRPRPRLANLVGPIVWSDRVVDFQLHLETDTVEQASPSPAVCAAPEESIRNVLRMLREARSGAVMVCRDEKLQGICTERDLIRVLAAEGNLSASSILHYLVQHFPKVVYTLPPAPHHKTQEREGA